jgi:hypothetical protein
MEEESLSQCCQRILRVMSTGGVPGTSTNPSTHLTDLSTANTHSVVSTNIVDIVYKAVSSSLDPVMERMAAVEERLGKLSA